MKNLIIISLLLFSSVAEACSCFMVPMSAMKIMESELVLEGKIIDKKVVDDPHSNEEVTDLQFSFGQYFKYTVQVKDLIKGQYSKRTISIVSSTQGSACGVNLGLNKVYYLYVYAQGGYFNTNLCSDNRLKDSVSERYKQIVRQFKKPKKNTIWKNEQCELAGKGKIVDGKAKGEWIFYHPDESIESHGPYNDGKKEGEWKSYYSKKASKALWDGLEEAQRAQVKNKENILYRVVQYKDGEMGDSKYLYRG